MVVQPPRLVKVDGVTMPYFYSKYEVEVALRDGTLKPGEPFQLHNASMPEAKPGKEYAIPKRLGHQGGVA
jgi:hypothetical protein